MDFIETLEQFIASTEGPNLSFGLRCTAVATNCHKCPFKGKCKQLMLSNTIPTSYFITLLKEHPELLV